MICTARIGFYVQTPLIFARGSVTANQVSVNFMETADTKEQKAPRAEEARSRREWDRSEWFRLWLELIRRNSPQNAVD